MSALPIFKLLNVSERAIVWQDEAICASVDAAIWFPPTGGSTARAKKICGECPVRRECLDYALEWEAGEFYLWGVYGGKSAAEREVILAQRGELGVVNQTPEGQRAARRRVLATLGDLADAEGYVTVSARQIAEACDLSRSAAGSHIRRLVRDGRIELVGGKRHKTYRVDAGNAALSENEGSAA